MAEGKSWANIAEKRPAVVESKKPGPAPAPDKTVAVIDANAIIGGSSPVGFAEELVTTPDVHAEVRDKQSKQALTTLPFGIGVQEPSEDSLAAVLKFARGTGEIHSLSTADMRLLALAHGLHTGRCGPHSLRSEPPPPRAVKRGKQGARQLPGWGASGKEWEALDHMEEAEMRAYEEAQGASASRIAADIHNLSLEETLQPGTPSQGQEAPAAAQQDVPEQETSEPAAEWPEEGRADSEGEWQVAAVSNLAARRRRKKEARRAARAAVSLISDSSARSHAPASGQPSTTEDGGESEEEGEGAELGSAGEDSGSEQDSGSERDSGAHDSGVSIVTADFAMQNVALQMGLHLLSPDGRRINRISRWVLRCSACFKVTKEMERLFCPTCGNAALQKVEVVVGEHGAEQYGVRKRHIIRGTKFSLPKPRGGRNSKAPILREDVLLAKMPRRKPKETSTDPFVPEYSSATWHNLRGSGPSAYQRGIAATLASWKHNPNERRHSRTNRRK